MTPQSRDDWLSRRIPGALDAVRVLQIVTELLLSGKGQRPMRVCIDGQLTIEGVAAAFFNPALDAGLMYCRALLQFVGLGVERGQLAMRPKKRPDDVGIEDFALPLVTPAQAIARYKGSADEAGRALAFVLHGTNKLLAHFTREPMPDDSMRLIEIASRGVPAIVISHLYTPLGLPAPVSQVTARRRAPSDTDLEPKTRSPR